MENVITLFGENEVEVSEETNRAYLLHQEIIFNRDQAAAHLYKMCCQLKEMRDSGLYAKLGFSDFDGYVEKAANIKKRQAYNYIRIIEQLGDDFVQSNAQLGVTKLALLTDVSPMDREEFVGHNNIDDNSCGRSTHSYVCFAINDENTLAVWLILFPKKSKHFSGAL